MYEWWWWRWWFFGYRRAVRAVSSIYELMYTNSKIYTWKKKYKELSLSLDDWWFIGNVIGKMFFFCSFLFSVFLHLLLLLQSGNFFFLFSENTLWIGRLYIHTEFHAFASLLPCIWKKGKSRMRGFSFCFVLLVFSVKAIAADKVYL